MRPPFANRRRRLLLTPGRQALTGYWRLTPLDTAMLPALSSTPHQPLARWLLSLLLLSTLLGLIGAPAWAADQAPTRTIVGGNTKLKNPYGVTRLADGSLAVSNNDNSSSVTVYAAGANGDVAPVRVISGDSTDLRFPRGLVELADGSLAVANASGWSVTVYPAGANGNVAPVRQITGFASPGFPTGLAKLADGSLAVTNQLDDVRVYAAGANGAVAPVRTIKGAATGLSSPYGLAVLADGSLAVANQGNNSVTVYAAGANGDVAPVRTIEGLATGLDGSYWVTAMADGKLAVSNAGNKSVTVYAAGANGDVAPVRTIEGLATGLNDPLGLVELADGSLAVANYSGPSVTVYAEPTTAINWVTVGNPGNAPDTTGYGAVSATFKIMGFEWTNAQYVAFLNAIDPAGSNPNGVYNTRMGSSPRGGISYTAGAASGSKYATKINMGNKPVGNASWFDAARVANWLHHGAQNYASTDATASAPQNTGAYTLGTATTGTAPVRNAGARYWIPTENEWYKAAYYSGSGSTYWLYGNGNSTTPTAVSANATGDGSAGGSGNFANYNKGADWNGQDGNVTTVGTNGAASAYGAFDLSGNVWEWNDLDGTPNTERGLRGGSYPDTATYLVATTRIPIRADLEGDADDNNGFRLATTPAVAPDAPTNLTATPGDGQATIAFTAPVSDGGAAITNYEYSTDDGTNWTARSPAATTSPLTITGLTDGTTYPVKLRAVNSVGAGTASSAVSVTPNACGPGLALPIGPPALWQQLALPCVPDAATPSVRDVLGTGATGQLDPLDYNSTSYATGANWWRLFRRDNSANANVLMPLDGASGSDLLDAGPGYWLKSLDAPVGGGNLEVTGTATVADVTLEQGCAVAAGCKAIDLVVAANRYNMIGNPFPYHVDWAQVRIQVDGSLTTLTPSAAETAGFLDKRIWIWNGTSYATFDDSTPGMIGNLKYFQSFWVKVLPGAVMHTLRLLIPAAASTHSQLAPTGSERLAAAQPWYQAWLDALIPPAGAAELALPPDAGQQTPGPGPERRPAPGGATGPAPTDPTIELLTTLGTRDGLDPAAADRAAHAQAQAQAEGREWYLRLKVDEPATGYRDHNSVLGQLLTAKNGRDPADLGEMPPFATPYLTLVFPHPDWGTAAGDYASDFRSAQRLNRRKPVAGLPAADWAFEIRTDRPGTPVVITWEGPPEILKRSRLIDRATGRALIPTAKAYAKGYRVTLTSGKGAFIWRFLGQP